MSAILISISIVLPFLLWLTWSGYQGREEGLQIASKCDSENRKLYKDFHSFWTQQRIVVGAVALLPYILVGFSTGIQIWEILFHSTLISLSLMLGFSYFHNGHLHLSVNEFWPIWKIDLPYPDGFKQSKDGPAKVDFTYPMRLALFIISIIIITYTVVASMIDIYKNANILYLNLVIYGSAITIFLIYKFIYSKKG